MTESTDGTHPLMQQTRDQARHNFEQLAAYKRIGEEMGIPRIIAEIWEGQQWKALGFATWDDACREYLGSGWRPWDSIDQRRSIVAELTERGMSTRAIGATLGVGQMTVVRDQASGESHDSPDPVPVVGLDGKTYPSPITRQQKQAADDLLNESQQQLQDYLEQDDEWLALQKRQKFARFMAHLAGYHIFDFDEMRDIEPPTDVDRRFIAQVIEQLQIYVRPKLTLIQEEAGNE
jgi:hypothetical protein